MFRSVVMSSIPVLATSMAMSPMWLSCNHWRISPNPMTSLRFVKLVGTVCMCNVRARVMGGGDGILGGFGLLWELLWYRGYVL